MSNLRTPFEHTQRSQTASFIFLSRKQSSKEAPIPTQIYSLQPDDKQKYFKTQGMNRQFSQQFLTKAEHQQPAFLKNRRVQREEVDTKKQIFHSKMLARSNTTQFLHAAQRQTQAEWRKGQPSAKKNVLKETSSTSSIEEIKAFVPSFVRNKHKKSFKGLQYDFSKERFKVLRKLGEGKSGAVFMVKDRLTNFIMAMKVIEKKTVLQQHFLEQLIRQIKIHAFLNHPNIIKFYGFFHDEFSLSILMELGCDGQLYELISQGKLLTEEAVSMVSKNLLEAAEHCHIRKILHRDIKPQNIVLVLGNIKLCDFGWAVNKLTKQQLRSTFCGTPLYLSPQVLKGSHYDEKVDVWSIGILAYELAVGRSPFSINEHSELFKIITDQIRLPKDQFSSQFQSFIRAILDKNPKERFSCQELLSLPFISKYDELETCEELCA